MKNNQTSTANQISEQEKLDLFRDGNTVDNTNVSGVASISDAKVPCGLCAVPDEKILEQFSTALHELLPKLKTRKKAEYAENMDKLIELLTKISQDATPWCRTYRPKIEELISEIELQDITRKQISAEVEEYVQSMTKELETMRRNSLVSDIETLLNSPLLTRRYKKAISVVAEMADLPLTTEVI